MENLSMCRICLATDVRMCTIASHLRDMYERITSVTFKREDRRPLVACYICHARLQNCYRLRTTCLWSEELLTEMMSSGVIRPQDMLNTNTFRVVSVLQFSTEPALQNTMECHVKEEALETILNDEPDPLYEDVTMDPQEEHYAQYDNNEGPHIEDSLYVIKREPDNFETDAEDIKLETDTIYPEYYQNGGPSSQLANNVCNKIVKIELERIDENYSCTGARDSKTKKIATLKDTEDTPTIKRKIKAEKYEKPGCITVEKPNIVTIKTEVENSETTCEIFENCEKMDAELYNCEDSVISMENSVCEDKATDNKYLEIHVNSKYKQFSCETCKKSFNSENKLKRHISTHTGENPHQCNICKKRFTKKSSLKIHIRIHIGEKPYQCNVCKKRFVEKSYLNRHSRIHTSEKPYQCEICKRGFNRKDHLRCHLRTHTDEKPYECSICHKGFNAKYSLRLHNRTHCDEPLHVEFRNVII